MQRGVDLWAAEIVLRLHDAGENVHLIAATPFKGMESRWNEEWQSRYSDVIKKADDVVYVSAKPGRAAFFQRNHYMVDHASYLLAVYSGGGGGTDFQIIFEYVQKHMQEKLPACIIILTDGFAPFPKEKLAGGIPVLWLLNNDEVDPPWGKIARITV